MPPLDQSSHGDGSPQPDGLGESLIRCPACDRTLAFDPSLAGQRIICPTCQRRLRMPTAGGRVVDLGHLPSSEQAAAWPPPRRASTAGLPQSYDQNPYAPLAEQSGRALRPAEASNPYALPGLFLVALSGPGLLMASMLLVYLLAAAFGGGGVGAVEFVIVTGFLTLAALSHAASFIGGMQMIRRRRLDLARLGAWAALYPCAMCMVLQIPIAIWALVVLHRSSAAADFQSPRDGSAGPLH